MKGNNFISKFYTKKIKKSFRSSVKSIFNNKYFWEIKLDNDEYIQAKSIILTCPFPQSKKIAGKYLEKKISNLKINMEPNITTMLAFKNQKAVPVSSIKFNDDIYLGQLMKIVKVDLILQILFGHCSPLLSGLKKT